MWLVLIQVEINGIKARLEISKLKDNITNLGLDEDVESLNKEDCYTPNYVEWLDECVLCNCVFKSQIKCLLCQS